MNNQKGFASVVGIFVGLAVAGVVMAVVSQVVPNDFAQTVMITIGGAIFGAGLTFFLIKANNLENK
jgi:prolipoprotein diacylglyceryltransferase